MAKRKTRSGSTARRGASARRKAKPAKPVKTVRVKTVKPRGTTAPAPARRAPAAIEASLAAIAHDVRTPLTGILALAELLATSDIGERERQWAAAIKSGAEHLAAITSLIIDAVRADADQLILQNDSFSPRRVAEAAGHALVARAETKGVTASVEIARDLPAMVAGDPLRLRAALENLADNAVKFTADGVVAMRVRAEPVARQRVRLVFEVSDNGIGLSPAEIKRLFRPFAQASAQVSRDYGGAGLGLVFVRRIAWAMHGDLTIDSKPGAGSTFRLTVTLPRADVRPDPATVRRAGARGEGMRVLCVEDNPYGRVVINTILSELGHRADFVETGEAAVVAAGRGTYDAVLMDVTLTGIDGLEATRRIRALPGAAGRTPVIGISGRSETGDAARKAGMNDYLVKPVSPARLAQALSELSSANL
ncbi:MAG: response regulator [Pseudolabrys sp.]|nr:response regulator [Pseudolabrys sp.]